MAIAAATSAVATVALLTGTAGPDVREPATADWTDRSHDSRLTASRSVNQEHDASPSEASWELQAVTFPNLQWLIAPAVHAIVD